MPARRSVSQVNAEEAYMRTLKFILAVSFVIMAAAGAVWTAECVVYMMTDSGEGSLRQCLLDAGNGDTITFSPMVFPPASPGTIAVLSALPSLLSGNIAVDASNAGVVLNGSGAPSATVGFVAASDSNSIRGVQILHFPSGGIVLAAGADHNTLEGNLISDNGGQGGLQIYGANNIVEGNLIGTDITGAVAMGNDGHGIYVCGIADNRIGPANTIAYNGECGIEIEGPSATGNTITQNRITDNTLAGISLSYGGNGELAVPVITECTETSIAGTAPPYCTIEVFSDAADEGKVYEGMTTSEGAGAFALSKPGGFAGEYITATATDTAGNTSEFSAAASVATQPTTWGKIKDMFD
jgi:parallel beta-helix repeat protein